MNILVTGGKGFIGQHLINFLQSTSHNVYCYDLVDNQDIRNAHDLDKMFELSGCKMVIHLAALAGVRRSTEYPISYISTNINGTLNVGRMCEKYKCRLINFSSSSVYGLTTPPIQETYKKEPVSIYGMTKLAAENIVNMLNVPTVTIRPFTVYGPNGRKDQVFYKWLNQYHSKQAITVYANDIHDISWRGYTYVDDIVQVLNTIIDAPWSWDIHEDFNIGGIETFSLEQIIAIYSSILPFFHSSIAWLGRPKSDIDCSYANINKAKRILGFKPKRNFERNLRKIISEEMLLWKK